MAYNSSSNPSAPSWLGAFARHLESVVERNEAVCTSQEVPCTLFHGTGPAPISLPAYLERVWRYSHCSPVCFVAAGIYLERLSARYPALEPTSLSVHRLLFTGVVIAIKFFDDKYYSNGFYAKVGGVSRSELNLLELEMLQLMGFSAYVGLEDVQRYLSMVSASPSPTPGLVAPGAHLAAGVAASYGPSRPSSGMASEADECESSNTGVDVAFFGADSPSSQTAAMLSGSCGSESLHALLGGGHGWTAEYSTAPIGSHMGRA